MQPIPRHSRDTFQCEPFVSAIQRVALTQWDYRDATGELHSGVAHGDRQCAECEAARFGHVPDNCPLTEDQRDRCTCIHATAPNEKPSDLIHDGIGLRARGGLVYFS